MSKSYYNNPTEPTDFTWTNLAVGCGFILFLLCFLCSFLSLLVI